MGIFDECYDYNLEVMANEPVRLGDIADKVVENVELECDAEELVRNLKMYEDGNLRARIKRDDVYL